MKYRIPLLFILLAFFIQKTSGNEIELRSKYMNTTNGLSNNSVRYLYQDSKGFIWMGTLNGLSRYDGNTFRNFYPERKEHGQFSLSESHIYNIQEDKNGFLWIGSNYLYSCYDLQNDRFIDFTGNGELEQIYSNLTIASNGDVWLWHQYNGARQIMHQPDRSMTSVTYKTEDGNLSDNRVQFIEEDPSGRIWIGTQRGLSSISNGNATIIDKKSDFRFAASYRQNMYFLTSNGNIYSHQTASGQFSLKASIPADTERITPTGHLILKDKWVIFTNTGVYDYHFETNQLTAHPGLNIKHGEVYTDNHHNYWIYNHTGRVYYILSDTEAIKEFQLIPPDKINYIDYERYHFIHDSRGIIWISTYGNGLFAYNVNEDKLEHFVSNAKNISPITSDFLLYMMEDRNGGIWVSSEFSGLSYINISNEGITRIYPESSDLFDRSNTIRMLTRTENGEIWVGTRRGGLYKYDLQLNSKTKEFMESNVYAIAEDEKGVLWIGTRGRGLKIGNTWYKRVPSDPSTISFDHIFSIHRDRKKRMWVGTFGGGLNMAEPTAEGGYKFRHFFEDQTGVKEVRSIAEDENGMIWMGTSGGICIFHPDSLLANPHNYHLYSYTNGKFNSNEIRYLQPDKDGGMWIGTSGTGINLATVSNDYQTLEYKHYGVTEGLANDMVQSLLSDDNGHLWVATEYGISKFDTKTHSFENYYFSSYTLGNVYSENCACMGANGKLYFGTNHGLAVIDPRYVPSNRFLSPVVLTNLYVNGIQMNPEMEDSPLKKSFAYSDEITLKYFQNSIIVDFTTFDYSDNEQTQYTYWLENYDKEWSKPSHTNSATYKYLSPGTYTLHVKSCNSAGIWNEKETTLKVVITPPFWMTIWALFIYLILLIGGLYFAFHVIRNFSRLRNRINVEKQLTEYKLVFFTNISHEFRTPLTLIHGALEKIQRNGNIPREQVGPLHIMEKNVQRMLRLITQLLEFRKMQNNKLALSLEKIDVIAFLKDIFVSFSDEAKQKEIQFSYQPSVACYPMFADTGKLDKIVYNLLSNALKYTPAQGSVTFSVTVDEDKKLLQMQVTDTGVGIPKEKQGELFKRFMQSNFSSDSIGIGLHLTHELVSVHKGSISYQENNGGGSIFTVCLPTDESIYAKTDFLVADNVLIKQPIEPVLPPPTRFEELSPLPEPSVNPLNKRKVLIIEDDNDIRQLLKEEIGIYFEVEVAEDGISGYEKACTYDADLIICDVLMPGMNGFEVTKKLKSEFQTCHIPIILLTALNSEENQLEGIEAGADAYISKPFSIKYLLTRVFRLIELREKIREKFSKEPGIMHLAMYTTDRDKEFVDRMTAILEKNIIRPEFSIEEFAQMMNLSRSVFYQKVKGITGYAPIEYLRIVRMKKAAEIILQQSDLTIAEVGYMVGYNDPFYFSKCFKSQFGISPSVYKKGEEKSEQQGMETDNGLSNE